MPTPTGIKQIGKPGGLVEPGIQQYGILKWAKDAWDKYKEYKHVIDPVAKTLGSLGKGYLDYKSQKDLNELTEQAYKDYMAQKEAAGQEAQAAIDLNLTPMQISNIPQTKADVSDFTLVAARGGLMNLPTRQRKRYAFGPNPDDLQTMDEMNPPFDPREEGVNISDMVFHDTGNDRTNAQQVWQSGQIDQGLYEMDFEIFFQSGDWQDHISRGTVQGDTQMAQGPDTTLADEMGTTMDQAYEDEFMKPAARGGIIGLRHGGRPGYQFGIGPQQGLMPQGMMPQQGLMPPQGMRPGYEMGLGPVGRGMGPEEIETESEWITQKKPDFFKDLYLDREGGGGKDYMVPEEASERADLNEIMIIGGDDMAKAEKIESERSIQGLYTQAIRILDKAWDIDEKLHAEINQTFIDAANDPDVSPANAYYTIIKKYGDILEMKKGGIAGLRYGGRPGYQEGIGPNQGSPSIMANAATDMEVEDASGIPVSLDAEIKEIAAGSESGENFPATDSDFLALEILSNKHKIDLEVVIQIAKATNSQYMAKGGRIRKAPGGIMNLGGMEKDYRTTGGFVPIGGRERADDVPARLSKNEFVMTADAVRAAGGGSINKGAQRMYDTMKHLEASPQSNRMIA